MAPPSGQDARAPLVCNFRFPNARPGGVIDSFSRSGLPIIGFNVHRMSVAEAEQFYGTVREVLGPTDPSKAPPGSIWKEFGQTVMINAAHASDSPENARREMGSIRVSENYLKPLLEAHGLHV